MLTGINALCILSGNYVTIPIAISQIPCYRMNYPSVTNFSDLRNPDGLQISNGFNPRGVTMIMMAHKVIYGQVQYFLNALVNQFNATCAITGNVADNLVEILQNQSIVIIGQIYIHQILQKYGVVFKIVKVTLELLFAFTIVLFYFTLFSFLFIILGAKSVFQKLLNVFGTIIMIFVCRNAMLCLSLVYLKVKGLKVFSVNEKSCKHTMK